VANKKQRMKNRETAKSLKVATTPAKLCVNCGVLAKSGHYVPSSFGDEGMWLCSYFKTKKGEE